MVATSLAELQIETPNQPARPRDSKGRILSLETIDLQDIERKQLDGKDWAGKHVKALMRASSKLCSVAIPATLERLLLYEKVMAAHLDRGMRLFGLGEHAGKHTLVICADQATMERVASRALASAGPASAPASSIASSAPAPGSGPGQAATSPSHGPAPALPDPVPAPVAPLPE